MCKRCEALSSGVLIGRGLDHIINQTGYCISDRVLFSFEGETFKEENRSEAKKAKLKASADSAQDPPVPMPNTEVKLSSAENTWVATPREDRTVLALFISYFGFNLLLNPFFFC